VNSPSVIHPRARLLAGCAAALVACSGAARPTARMSPTEGQSMNRHPAPMIAHVAAGTEDDFRALEVGADFRTSMTRVNTDPFLSRTHGGRWVNTYVNAVGLAAYQRGEDLPVGSVVVKESFEPNTARDGPDLAVRGPIFVMERRARGYYPERGDYWYAIWIENPTGRTSLYEDGRASPSVYWRGHSARIQYCEDCHADFDNRMGGVPRAQQAWTTAGAAPAAR
jgi:hypothetical protein